MCSMGITSQSDVPPHQHHTSARRFAPSYTKLAEVNANRCTRLLDGWISLDDAA
jgi:hypothetical protein